MSSLQGGRSRGEGGPRGTSKGHAARGRGGTDHVYLVPGFFGFANIGRITYFGHVRRILATRFAALGLNARIHVVRTPPTATARDDGALHLIGHSSGGLDARLLTAPDVALPTRVDVERLAARVRTVVTLSTPHHGTPLASFFTTLQGVLECRIGVHALGLRVSRPRTARRGLAQCIPLVTWGAIE